MAMKLTLAGLAKSYPDRPVFSEISAEVEFGRRLMVTGPNGSGKSTLIRIICGFIRPTKGTVVFDLDSEKLSRIDIRPHVGLVSPDLVLYDELTANENLAFFAGVAGTNLEESELPDRLESVGLAGRGHDLVGSYSSGMKQRLK